MAVRSTAAAPNLPLTDAQITLVRQHVPENILAELGDWTAKLPVISQFFNRISPAVPAVLDGRLFFNEKFADSKKQEMTGIALSLFYQREKNPMQEPCIKWEIREIAFKNGQCVGLYNSNEYYPNGFRDNVQEHEMDAHDPSINFTKVAADKLETWMYMILGDASKTASFPAPALSASVPELQPAPVASAHTQKPPQRAQAADAEPAHRTEAHAPAQPAARAWYQVIGDALGGCIASLVDCFKRFFGLTT